jgi:hypothetical protein
MLVTQFKGQHETQTLEEFYLELARDHPNHAEVSDAMVSLLTHLQALPDTRHFVALTSHAGLCFIPDNSRLSFSWHLVSIFASDKQNYYLEYRMPDRLAPWKNSRMSGKAHSEDEAIEMILKAIDLCEGWSSENWSEERLKRKLEHPEDFMYSSDSETAV